MVSDAYEYYLKHSIKEKLQTLAELELPLLKEKGLLKQVNELSTNSKILRANSKVIEQNLIWYHIKNVMCVVGRLPSLD